MTSNLIVAPTEPAELRKLGIVSFPLTERYGADFLVPTKEGFVGVQRKELMDFVASVRDGRLHEDYVRMRELQTRILLFEGVPAWDPDGNLVSVSNERRVYTRFSRATWWGLMLSLQHAGIWVMQTQNIRETAIWLDQLAHWVSKGKHTSLDTRPGPAKDAWGKTSQRGWECHLLQSFPGVGPELAEAICEYFGAPPLAWTVTEKDLCEVEGIGKTRAKRMLSCLAPKEGEPCRQSG